MAGRTLIVGDVHGCYDELTDLLRACRYTDADHVVFVGDLVAKGPKSAEVVRWAREHGASSVLGNHDHAVLEVLDGKRPSPRPTHSDVASALAPEDVAWLRALPLWLDVPEHGVRVVHAGLDARVPMDAQDPSMLMTMRTVDADGRPSRDADAGPLWASRYQGPPFIAFGHHASSGLQQHPAALGLDTGCVYGRHLSAYLLPTRKIVSVRARQTYVQAPGPGRTYAGPTAGLGTEPRVIALGPSSQGRPREALVLRDGHGEARAYENLCRHIPVPLDAGSRRFLSAQRTHLLCGTHGAKFRLDDGMCVEGPCTGLPLHPLSLLAEHGSLWIVDP